MSKATKRKHVTKEVLEDFVLPELNQEIVRVTASRGNNLHEVETPGGEKYLVSMPTKFRKNVWIKRGDYVLVTPIQEGDKVKAEIINILYKEQIKYIKDEGQWPAGFSQGESKGTNEMIPEDMLPPSGSDSDCEDADDRGITRNPNRPQVHYCESDEDDSDDDDEEEEEEEAEEGEEGQQKNGKENVNGQTGLT